MFTLFQVVTGDSWGSKIAAPLLKHYPACAILSIPFILLISFGLTSIVLGVFCENAIYAASDNTVKMQTTAARDGEKVVGFITNIFKTDSNAGGSLSREHFEDALGRRSVKQQLHSIDLPANDLRILFDLLDKDDMGQIL